MHLPIQVLKDIYLGKKDDILYVYEWEKVIAPCLRLYSLHAYSNTGADPGFPIRGGGRSPF
jgi:hypothetical protein